MTTLKTRTNQAKAGKAKVETGAPLKHPNSNKLVECFHCSGNHYISDCPDITPAQKAELLAARTAAYNKRREEKAARDASGGADTKSVGFVEGQLHLNVDPEIISAEAQDQWLLDEAEEEDFAFLQPNSDPKLVAKRKTLDPNKLYLDSTSSFHQMFTEQHLEDIKKSDVTLKGHCNAEPSYSDEKGRYHDLFELWLVRHGIANLLSIPRLEKDGFRVTYDTLTTWEIHCPDEKIITLKCDTGLCDRFLYLDMKEHKEEIAMLQMVPTIRANFKGYTKRDIKDAIFACKAQQI